MRTQTGESIHCTECNVVFYLPPWRLKQHGKNKFCTRNCYEQYWNKNVKDTCINKAVEKGKNGRPWRRNGSDVQCVNCLKIFYRSFSTQAKKNYCSKKCTKGRHWGEPLSPATRHKISEALKGENAPNWKGGLTPINKRIRNSKKYVRWRNEVYRRDNYTCVLCGARSGKGKTVILNADHIKPFAYYIDLRFNVENGRTLCVPCHKKTDTFANKAKINYGINYNNN